MKRRFFVLVFLALTATIFLLHYKSIDAASPKFWKLSLSKTESILHEGDIIFQSSKAGQSLAVQLATKSKYSHCGIIFQEDGQWMVCEAVQPVQTTPFDEWIKHGDGGHYVVKRLKDNNALSPEVIGKMKQMAKSFLGKDYDGTFEWNDQKMYCSELVWKLYYRTTGISVGEQQKLGSLDLSHPEVKKIILQRYGNDIPVNEVVISPGNIFNSPNLLTVISK